MATQYEYWFGHATGTIQMNLFYCVSVLYLNGEARDQSLQDVAGAMHTAQKLSDLVGFNRRIICHHLCS